MTKHERNKSKGFMRVTNKDDETWKKQTKGVYESNYDYMFMTRRKKEKRTKERKTKNKDGIGDKKKFILNLILKQILTIF